MCISKGYYGALLSIIAISSRERGNCCGISVKMDRGLSRSSEEAEMCGVGDYVCRLLGLLGWWTFF